MSRDRNELLASLGLDPTQIREIARAAVPDDVGVSHGYANDVPADEFSVLFRDVELSRLIPGLALSRHQREPSVLRVDGASGIAGAARRSRGYVFLDGRKGQRAMALVDTAEGPMVVETGADGIVVSAARADEESYARWDDWQPLPSDVRPLPPLPKVSTRWLREHVERLSSLTSPVDLVAAAGAVVRFHVPEPSTRAAVLSGAAIDPSEPVADWARALEAREREVVERLAMERAARLYDWLSQLGDEPDAEEVLGLARERDILESVQVVLWLARAGQRLSRELRAIDDLASTKLSRIAPAAVLEEDEQLAAVGGSEPDAWWGVLGSVERWG